jgi:hypothetical protein
MILKSPEPFISHFTSKGDAQVVGLTVIELQVGFGSFLTSTVFLQESHPSIPSI